MKHLIDIDDLSLPEIEEIFTEAQKLLTEEEFYLKDCRMHFSGKTAILLFFENSTRTFLSFSTALEKMGIKIITLNIERSAFSKGESLLNFFKNIAAMQHDLLIVRHASSTIFHLIKNIFKCPIINAGNGIAAHPTQALLDVFTMRQFFPDLHNRNIAIIGDIKHSRVAKSNIKLLSKFNAKISLIAPKVLLSEFSNQNSCFYQINRENLSQQDIIMLLRIQLERIAVLPITKNAYYKNYALKTEHLKCLRKECIILHPGPANITVEIDDEVMNNFRSKVFEQVRLGVMIRIVLMKKLMLNI